MKTLVWLLIFVSVLMGKDIVVYENEFYLYKADKTFSQIIVGNRDLLNVNVLEESSNKTLKIFGKKSGNTSVLIRYSDGTLENFQVYVNQNLGFIQKMINTIAPGVKLSRAGDGATVLSGVIDNPHQKRKVLELLKSAGIDANSTMDIVSTKKVEKMVRTKLYLVSIDNSKALELGGAVGMNYMAKDGKIVVNGSAQTYATFSGFLLDNTLNFANTGKSLLANLTFLQSKGIARVLDDTVLLTTEDKNASFHVGGQVYIPIGVTYDTGNFPTLNLKEKEYGLRLTMKPNFLESTDFMAIKVDIIDSEFDTDPTHKIQLGPDIFVPAFKAKNITTDIVAQSGQVIALGGRLHTENVKRVEKVPLLGDIPVLGHLFKNDLDSTQSNDLIFFLVPEIVDGNDAIDDAGFYKSFKKESEGFHHQIIDNDQNSSKQTKTVLNNEESVKETSTAVVKCEEEAGQDQKNQGALVESVSKEATVIASNVKKDGVDTLYENYYEVTSSLIYIRDKPKKGKKITTWKGGHRFIANEMKKIKKIEWLKITEDCSENVCRAVKQEMWISKKHTRKIS